MGTNTGNGIYRSPVHTSIPGAPAWSNSKGNRPPQPQGFGVAPGSAAWLSGGGNGMQSGYPQQKPMNPRLQPMNNQSIQKTGAMYAQPLKQSILPSLQTGQTQTQQLIPSTPINMGQGGAANMAATPYQPPNAQQFNQGIQDNINQYGANAYEFTPATDYNHMVENWTDLGQKIGMTPDQAAIHMTGKPMAYWQQMQQMYDAGLHPTTSTQYDPNWKPS